MGCRRHAPLLVPKDAAQSQDISHLKHSNISDNIVFIRIFLILLFIVLIVVISWYGHEVAGGGSTSGHEALGPAAAAAERSAESHRRGMLLDPVTSSSAPFLNFRHCITAFLLFFIFSKKKLGEMGNMYTYCMRIKEREKKRIGL